MPLKIRPSDPSLAILADLIHQKTGLAFENNRMELLADKLAALISAQGFDSVMDYFYFLKYDPLAGEEWTRLYSTLAVNETYFWREFDQIHAAVEEIVPRLQRERPGVPVRIWHAACASGEEPYTMAMALNEAGLYDRGPIEIIATDFNQTALDLARKGIYRRRSFRSIPPNILLKYFTPLEKEAYRLSNSITERVQFSPLNLFDAEAMALMRNFDLIFCRNVFIYFSNESVRRVVDWLERSLNPSGTLFVAAAESLLQVTQCFDLVEIDEAFGYQKRDKGLAE
jgi:chemotaxis protein methyltransferase CheR